MSQQSSEATHSPAPNLLCHLSDLPTEQDHLLSCYSKAGSPVVALHAFTLQYLIRSNLVTRADFPLPGQTPSFAELHCRSTSLKPSWSLMSPCFWAHSRNCFILQNHGPPSAAAVPAGFPGAAPQGCWALRLRVTSSVEAPVMTAGPSGCLARGPRSCSCRGGQTWTDPPVDSGAASGAQLLCWPGCSSHPRGPAGQRGHAGSQAWASMWHPKCALSRHLEAPPVNYSQDLFRDSY